MVRDKSIVLSAVFPSSKTGIDGLRRALDRISHYDINTVEYYCEGCSPIDVSALLKDKRSVFLGAARQKAMGLNPCSPKKEERDHAVAQLTECLRFASLTGANAFMINSGRRPVRPEDDNVCLEWLADSILRLHHAQPEMPILLEPGDRDIEYRHLVGPSEMAVNIVRSLQSIGVPISLVFDISHAAQLGEVLEEAWAITRPVCNHVHLANCILNRDSRLYGDKHPFFGVDGGIYSHEDAKRFLSLLEEDTELYTAGLEMICPHSDEESFFRELVADTDWFFNRA